MAIPRSRRQPSRTAIVTKSNNFTEIKPCDIKVTFEEIIGHTEAKKELGNILQFLQNPERYFQFGIIPYCKYLLVGPEGVGKETIAKAIAKAADLPLFVVEPSFFYDTENVLQQLDILFSKIQNLKNTNKDCILLIKNIEYLSGFNQVAFQPVLERLLGYFRDLPDLVAFATLSVSGSCEISKYLLDPVAFKKVIQLSFPTLKEREQILEVLLKELKKEENLDIHRLALNTYQMSYGDMKNLIREAGLLTLRYNQETITCNNIVEALAQTNFGYVKNKLNDKERLSTARHEAGHVIAKYFSDPQNAKFSKVEITPRAFYAGITEETVDEEKITYFQQDIKNQIISCFGGMASEEFYYKATSTGVINDLKQATNLAIAYFKAYGMSKEIGPIYLLPDSNLDADETEALIINQHMPALNAKTDLHIQTFLKDLYEETFNLIKTNSECLDELTNALLEKEVLYSNEIMEILKKHSK